MHPSVQFPVLLTCVPLNVEDLLNALGDGEGGGGSREDYSAEDVEYYFNYSGILAERGSYDQLEDLLDCELFFPSHASCTSPAPTDNSSLCLSLANEKKHAVQCAFSHDGYI